MKTIVDDFLNGLENGYTAETDKARLLMEAAPDLLAALNGLYDSVLSGDPIPHNSSSMQAAMRAIIKAQGEL